MSQCRHRFLEVQYQRSAAAGEVEHTERTVLFLVNAWSLARPDKAAATAVAAARAAPEQETAAKQAVSEAESAAKRTAEVGCDTKPDADRSTANLQHPHSMASTNNAARSCTQHCQNP